MHSILHSLLSQRGNNSMGCTFSSLHEPSAASATETTEPDIDQYNKWTGSSEPVSMYPRLRRDEEPKGAVREPRRRDPTNGWGFVMVRRGDPRGKTVQQLLDEKEERKRKRREEKDKEEETSPEEAAAPRPEEAVEGHNGANPEVAGGNAANESAANAGTNDTSAAGVHTSGEAAEPAAPHEPQPAPAPAPTPAPDPAPAPDPTAAITALTNFLAANPAVVAALTARAAPGVAANTAPTPNPPTTPAEPAADPPAAAHQNNGDDDDDDGSAIDWADPPPRRSELHPLREMERQRILEQQRQEQRYWNERWRRRRSVHFEASEGNA